MRHYRISSYVGGHVHFVVESPWRGRAPFLRTNLGTARMMEHDISLAVAVAVLFHTIGRSCRICRPTWRPRRDGGACLRSRTRSSRRNVSLNLTGAFLCAQAAARSMVKQRSGKIINIVSLSGQRGGIRRAAYGASKAGLELLTKVMAVELAEAGIQSRRVRLRPTRVARCTIPRRSKPTSC